MRPTSLKTYSDRFLDFIWTLRIGPGGTALERSHMRTQLFRRRRTDGAAGNPLEVLAGAISWGSSPPLRTIFNKLQVFYRLHLLTRPGFGSYLRPGPLDGPPSREQNMGLLPARAPLKSEIEHTDQPQEHRSMTALVCCAAPTDLGFAGRLR